MDAMTFAAFQLDAQRAAQQRHELAIRAAQAARVSAAQEPTSKAAGRAGGLPVCEQGDLALAGPSA